MIPLFLLSLFVFIQFPSTDQFYQTDDEKKECEIWKEECQDVCKPGWIKVCEVACLKKQIKEKCKIEIGNNYGNKIEVGGPHVCPPEESMKEICKKECFYNWHHKKPYLNLLAKKSAKMDKGKALKSLEHGIESLANLEDTDGDGSVTRHEVKELINLLKKAWACTNLQSCTVVGWKKMCMEVKKEGNCTPTTKGTTDLECEKKKKSRRKVCAKLQVDTHKWYANAVPKEVCAELREWNTRVCTEGGLVGKCTEVYSLDACAKACTSMGGTKEVCTQMCACANPQEGLQALGDALETINAVLNAFGISEQKAT